MEKSQKTKIVAIALSLLIIALSMFRIDTTQYALSPSNTPFGCFSYHFFHVNVFHALMNSWCLLGLAFFYHLRLRDIIIAFAVAASFPPCLCTAPTVGLSGMLYALMGLLLPQMSRKLFCCLWLAAWNIAALLIGGSAVEVHAYCFCSAVVNNLLYNRIFRL